jgi:hypothetical protein
VSTVCRCSSCEEAGSLLERMPLSTPVLEADRGTHFVLFRKDRVFCLKGEKLLAEHRLRPESPTRTNGHWLSVYRKRVPMADELLARKAGYFLPRLGYPAEPLVSFQINRQLSGWNPPPLVIRAFGAHGHFLTHAAQH